MRLSQEELTANIDDDFKAVVAKLQTTFNFMAAKLQQGRSTHTYGAVAKGEARCIVPADFPANDTFVLGKVFPIVLRHSSPGGRSDDRARDGVAAAIKFFEPGKGTDGDGIYDILMNAGRQLFVRSIRDFSTFVHTPDAERIKLVQQGIMLEPQLIEAYRIRGSFTDFRYYTWVCFEFIDSAGVSRYVRFRLINHDRGPDRGLPNAAFRANGRPSMEPVPDDTRAPDFLRKDFLYRVKYSDVRYILQAQLRDAPNPAVVNHELFDPSQPWNEYWYPWVDMFEVRLTETVEDQEACRGWRLIPTAARNASRFRSRPALTITPRWGMRGRSSIPARVRCVPRCRRRRITEEVSKKTAPIERGAWTREVKMITIRKVKIAIGVAAVVLVVAAVIGFKLYRDKLYVGPARLPADLQGRVARAGLDAGAARMVSPHRPGHANRQHPV